MALVKFLRGLDAKYSYNLTPQTTAHENAIYFATDKGYLYVNGIRYGGDDAVKVKDVTVDGNILTVTYTDNNTKEINILNLLPEAVANSEGVEGSKGLLSASDKTFIDELNAERESGMAFISAEQAQTIADVKAGNYENKVETVSGNILSITGKDITATVSLAYENNTIKLLGKDGADLGTVDTTPFIKDGMLDDVEIVEASEENPVGENKSGKFIVFTWKVQDGETKTDWIPVADLAKTYTAGNAIELSESNEIAVVVAESTEAETNYLVNDGGLKVSEMGADVTVTKEAIPIAGGPLASYFDDVYTDEIPANTSIESLLFSLVCQEKWPNPAATASYGTLTSTLSAPSSTQSWSGSSKLVELGSSITVGKVTASNATPNSPKLTFDNFASGYATTTGKHTASKTESNPASVNATVTTATEGVEYTLSRTYSNFTMPEGHGKDSVSGALASGLSFAEETVKANVGKNTVSFKLEVNKQIHSATVAAPNVYYALSNLGNTDKNGVTQQTVDKTATHTYTPNPAIPASKSSSTYEVTGVRPVYSNINSGAFKSDADVRFALQTGTTFAFSVPTEVGSASNFMFDYPNTHSISSFNVKDLQGNWVPFSAYYNAESTTVTKTIQGVDYVYKRLTTGGGNGPAEYQIILNKTLNQ